MGSIEQSLKFRGLLLVSLLVGAECVRMNFGRSDLLQDMRNNRTFSTGRFGGTVCRPKDGEGALLRYVAKVEKLKSLDAALDNDDDLAKCFEMAGRIDRFRKCGDSKVLSQLPPLVKEVMYHHADQPYSEAAAQQVAKVISELGLPAEHKLEPLDIQMQQANIKLITHLFKYLRPQYGCLVNPGRLDPVEWSQAVNPAVTLDEQLFGKHCTVESFIELQPDTIKEHLRNLRQALQPIAADIKDAATEEGIVTATVERHISFASALADGLEGSLGIGKDFAQLVREHKDPALQLPVISEPVSWVASNLTSPESTLQVAAGLRVTNIADLTTDQAMDFVAVVLIACAVGLALFFIGNVIWCYTTEDTRWQGREGECVTSFLANRGKRF